MTPAAPASPLPSGPPGRVAAPKRSWSDLETYGLWAFLAAILGGLWVSPFTDFEVLTYAVVITTLAFLPMLLWLRSGSLELPAFEILLLTGVQFYGYPLFSGHGAVAVFSADEIRPAALAMILFQISAILTYKFMPGIRHIPKTLLIPLLDDRSSKFTTYGLFSVTAYLYLQRFTDIIPYEWVSSLRALFYGINTVSIFIAMRRWGAGHLPRQQRFLVVLNMVVQCAINTRSLYLLDALILNATAALAYVSTSRRLPIIPILLIAPMFAFLHLGKPAMRAIYWNADAPAENTITDLPRFFGEWIDQSAAAYSRGKDAEEGGGVNSLIDRASLFQMLCIVTNVTPNFVPFLDGKSYVDIPNQLIPRVLNPDKKSSVDSNRLLSVHYKLTDEAGSFGVSIAFGLISEAFANYSFYGCALLGVFWGALYKIGATAAVNSPSFSAVGIIQILLSAWALQAEMIMAIWIVSITQAIFCVVGLPLLWKWFNQRS